MTQLLMALGLLWTMRALLLLLRLLLLLLLLLLLVQGVCCSLLLLQLSAPQPRYFWAATQPGRHPASAVHVRCLR
jgi:hypothetical protein